jgi:hypothetical protein
MSSRIWAPESCDIQAWDDKPFEVFIYDSNITYATDPWYGEGLQVPQSPMYDFDMETFEYAFEYPPIISDAPKMLPIAGGGHMSYVDDRVHWLSLSCSTCDTYFSGTYSSGGHVRHTKRAYTGKYCNTIIDTAGCNIAPNVPSNGVDGTGHCPVVDNDNSSCHDWYCHDCGRDIVRDCGLHSALNNNPFHDRLDNERRCFVNQRS